jgi:hypothetical protein
MVCEQKCFVPALIAMLKVAKRGWPKRVAETSDINLV